MVFFTNGAETESASVENPQELKDQLIKLGADPSKVDSKKSENLQKWATALTSLDEFKDRKYKDRLGIKEKDLSILRTALEKGAGIDTIADFINDIKSLVSLSKKANKIDESVKKEAKILKKNGQEDRLLRSQGDKPVDDHIFSCQINLSNVKSDIRKLKNMKQFHKINLRIPINSYKNYIKRAEVFLQKIRTEKEAIDSLGEEGFLSNLEEELKLA